MSDLVGNPEDRFSHNEAHLLQFSLKHGLEVLCNNDEKTLGFQLELYSRYIDSVKVL